MIKKYIIHHILNPINYNDWNECLKFVNNEYTTCGMPIRHKGNFPSRIKQISIHWNKVSCKRC